MHIALASGAEPDFKPEEFSLHYQRSVYSSLQSLVRVAFQSLSKTVKKLPDDVRSEAEEVLAMKDKILTKMKKILFTGKDFIILDFEGEPALSYSERRLKRSALRDVAGMLRSLHYAAYGSLFLDNQVRPEDVTKLLPYVEQWYHYMSGFFVKSYLETVKDSLVIPQAKEDLQVLIETFLLQKAVYELNYELNNRPGWVTVPLRGIKAIMKSAEFQTV
jgi:maltose alpha-D-glucosyltransferase/alpha-amylase